MVDITCDVTEIDITSGASSADGLITQINGTSGGLTVYGSDYNPWSGPWAGMLTPDLAVDIRWRHVGDTSWIYAFTGVVDVWSYDRIAEISSVSIIDATGGLANLDLPTLAVPVGQGETISARMNRILTAANVDPSRWSIATDLHPVISTTLGAKAWDLLDTAADTGIGLMFVDRTGMITYLPVGQAGGWFPTYRPEILVDWHSGPDPNQLCVLTFANNDPVVVRNSVSITRAADPAVDGDTPVTQTATDPPSIKRFGTSTYSRDDLINQSDAWGATIAAAVLQGGAWPAMHPQSADLDVNTDARVADLLLGALIGEAIHVRDSGQAFLCVIVGYMLTLTRASLTGSLVLSDVTLWLGGAWDTDTWDNGAWSI
jgi:hypothetical protein